MVAVCALSTHVVQVLAADLGAVAPHKSALAHPTFRQLSRHIVTIQRTSFEPVAYPVLGRGEVAATRGVLADDLSQVAQRDEALGTRVVLRRRIARHLVFEGAHGASYGSWCLYRVPPFRDLLHMYYLGFDDAVATFVRGLPISTLSPPLPDNVFVTRLALD